MEPTMKIAAAAWKLLPINREEDFFSHLREFFDRAADVGAEWLVLPELPILELLSLEPHISETDAVDFLLDYAETYEQTLAIYARAFGIQVVGGSHFRRELGLLNTCSVVERAGTRRQPKNNLTRYEREPWGLDQGIGLTSFDDPRIGVLICYDSEFPEAARSLALGGVEVLFVPAFTESRHGFQRVRWCCQARAIENQIFVVHASLVGGLGREPVVTTYGSSAILAPSHEPFPESAVLAETPLNQEGIAVAELDFEELARCRQGGDVQNWNDRDSSTWRHQA
jgi:predicted amidohydrolase